MSITKRFADLSYVTVLVVCLVLLVIRYFLLRQGSARAKWLAEVAESLAIAMALVFFLIRPFVVQAFFVPSGSMYPTLLDDDHILVNEFVYRISQPKRGDVIVFRAPPLATGGKPKDFVKRVIALPGDTVRITPGHVVIDGAYYNHNDLRYALSQHVQAGADRTVKITGGAVRFGGRIVTRFGLASAIGDPNAEVTIVPGEVYVNGKAIAEPYTAEDPDAPYPDGPGDLAKSTWLATDKTGHRVVRIPRGRLLVVGDNRNNSYDARFWGLLNRNRVLGKVMFIFWPVTRLRWVH